ncbi:hypothetical protein Q0Z83_054510 [Actinoplanes sichuanensis]|uniref:Uncharacterized protein n=1 Tax=Actinoplanes sichuanensis TaxID=512349 RepID=A0ABW4AQ75_9ACTN|nr:hypothetical protein [Actinoplanes sichuanensis]BEL07260.1 hypothetical protein Q0Z83_054510 [Actinoplanes sichuanensis]
MNKSLTFRVISGVIVASTLLVVPATATAAVRELTRPTPVDSGRPATTATATAATGGSVVTAAATGGSVATVAGGPAGTSTVDAGRRKAAAPSAQIAASLPFRVSVPGAAASGVYTSNQGNPQVAVTLKVAGQAPCGILQVTRNGPADGIEWHTVGALCSPGTATFRTQVNRLWGSRALPSIRLCNGDSLGLAEGVDCDRFTPPRGA